MNAPVFIIGPPRSGTTLLYQLMVTAFDVSYIPNIANTFYKHPVLVTKIAKTLYPPYSPTWQSSFGVEKGLMAPSEGGNVWNRWFPHAGRDGYEYTTQLDPRDKIELTNMINGIEKIFDAPFLNKNVKMSVRIPALLDIYHNTCFIVMERDFDEVVTSNIKMRQRFNRAWMSVAPKEYNRIKRLPIQKQVTHQIKCIIGNIETDLAYYRPLYTRVKYHQLVSQPYSVIAHLADLLKLELRDDTEGLIEKIPFSFKSGGKHD